MTLAERVNAFLNPQKVEQKAVTGPGAYVMEYHEPLSRGQRNPQKFMRAAQTISRKNPWVNTAEGIICGKGSTVPWHIEDPNEDTLEAGHPLLSLLERPNPQMTRAKLWGITLRHMGVCGNAYWFLDQLDGLAGTPQAIYYINPARMRPATDKRGNLTGWVLDADEEYEFEGGRQTGIGLDLREVLHFTLDEPDWGYLGHGLVEAAESLLALNGAAERYLTQVLATGGRRGHFIGPKDGRMDDDVFQSLVNGLRNVAESPDAAKRNIVTKGPIETQPQAVTPNEVGATGVLTEMREDIVSGVWRVPLSQLGVPLPAGLNSGESRKYEEAALWQNAIEPRLKPFAETVQFQLLDRWQVLGQTYELVLETPSFDDNQPAYDLLAKTDDKPITWNEKRALIGLDPLPEFDAQGNPLGLRITMNDKLVDVAAGPDPTGVAPVVIVSKPTPPLLPSGEQKATITAPFSRVRDRLESGLTPKVQRTVAAFLDAQKSDIIGRLRERVDHLLRKPGDTSWWSQTFWDDRLRAALLPALEPVATSVSGEARSQLGQKADPDEFSERVLAFVRGRVGERITGINDTTRAAILAATRDAITDAIREGMSPAEAADLLQERVSGLTTWNDARAELIARTELMNAYNDAALHSYREYDVREVQALDGDVDEECAARNGRTYPIDEAFGISDHPNGTLDWVPIREPVAAKADVASTADVLTAALRQMAEPPEIIVPPTVVNMEPPIVNVPAPVVNVKAAVVPAPEVVVNVPPAVVNVAAPDMTPVAKMLGELKAVFREPRTKEVTARDKEGRILRVKES